MASPAAQPSAHGPHHPPFRDRRPAPYPRLSARMGQVAGPRAETSARDRSLVGVTEYQRRAQSAREQPSAAGAQDISAVSEPDVQLSGSPADPGGALRSDGKEGSDAADPVCGEPAGRIGR